MALIEIHADIKLLTAIMERIARALERLLLEAYAIRMGHCAEPARDEHPKVPPTVDYASDEDLVREKLIDLFALARQSDPDSAVEQDRDV